MEIFNRPQVTESSRQYLLLRTDTGKLQKTVVGSFKLGQNNEHESIKKTCR